MSDDPTKSELAARPAGKRAESLARLRRRVYETRLGGLFAVVVALLLAESLSSWLIVTRQPELKSLEPVFELGFHLAVILPTLFVLFVAPTLQSIGRRDAAERALRAEREDLARRVRERTAELEEANRLLREEAQARAAAQQAIEFQASLLGAVDEAVVATDGEGRVRYWNRFAEVLYGWDASEAVGRNLRDLVAVAPREGLPLDLAEIAGERAAWAGEVDTLGRGGARFPTYLSCSRLPGAAGGRLFVAVDLSEVREAEQARRESETKYSYLLERSPTGIFIFQDGRLVFVNPRLADLLGYTRDELLQADPLRVVHAEDQEMLLGIARDRLEGRPAPEEYECRLVAKSGEIRWVAMRNTLIRHEGRVATLGNVLDVTGRRLMEQRLHELSARLMTIQEEERRRVARDLHDSLGQKLTGIKFLVEAALGEPWPEERRGAMGQLRELVPVIQNVVEEVRSISTALRPSILDDLGLLPTIAWHVREFGRIHPGFTVEQRLAAAESDVPDELRTPIFRVLQEATTNVAKHSGASRMVVGLETAGGRLRLWVEDDGIGFRPDAPPADGRPAGVGMGSMRERTQLTGGVFSVRSAPGAGTTVTADWPLEPAVSA